MRLELCYVLSAPGKWKRERKVQAGRPVEVVEKPVECFAVVTGDEEEATIREVAKARELAGKIAQAFEPVEALPEGTRKLFTVWLDITGVHRENARYSLGRRRFDGCPSFVSEDAMRVYAQIKRVFRKNIKERRGGFKPREKEDGRA